MVGGVVGGKELNDSHVLVWWMEEWWLVGGGKELNGR